MNIKIDTEEETRAKLAKMLENPTFLSACRALRDEIKREAPPLIDALEKQRVYMGS